MSVEPRQPAFIVATEEGRVLNQLGHIAREKITSEQTGGAADSPGQSAPQPSEPKDGEEEAGRPPGPAESSGRLWVPGQR